MSTHETGDDPQVVHPEHYTQHPIECWKVIQHFDFLRGSAIKYIWRAQDKHPTLEGELRDIDKAIECLQQYKEMRIEHTERWAL